MRCFDSAWGRFAPSLALVTALGCGGASAGTASARIRDGILQPEADEALLESLRALWHAARAKARGTIDG